jgi:SPP1 family predicted phage head-tail adaptor
VVVTAPPLPFNETFDSRRNQSVSDGQGGWEETLAPHLEGVRCRVRPWTMEDETVARQDGTRVSHIMYVPGDTDVGKGDEVTVRGMIADVRAVREPSQTGHHLMVDLEERQTGVTEPGES